MGVAINSINLFLYGLLFQSIQKKKNKEKEEKEVNGFVDYCIHTLSI